MLTSFQYRLQQHESVPPADTWQIISLRLNEEFHAEELMLSKKLTAYTPEPPANLWSAISSELQMQTAPIEAASQNESRQAESRSDGARVISFNWPGIAIAAAIIGVAISALYYFVSSDNSSLPLSITNTDPGQRKAEVKTVPAPVSEEPIVSVPRTTMAMTGGLRLIRKRPKNEVAVQQASYEPETSNQDISYANITGTDRLASAENISIPTSPIRDNRGNIIMDEKLISAPDKNYVTVTSPNGEQTKISKKFLHALSYMNAASNDESKGVTFQQSALWKWLFKEWRQRLLKQPSFIPSTTNFLDIIELKEILHENF